MSHYFPIAAPAAFKCADSDMQSLLWQGRGIVAYFVIPQSEDVLCVRFDRVHVIRVLDEMPLSTEEAGPHEGLVSNHFAYRVEHSSFWKSQSPTLYATSPSATHYRFITGWACLDVIADAPPTMTVGAAP